MGAYCSCFYSNNEVKISNSNILFINNNNSNDNNSNNKNSYYHLNNLTNKLITDNYYNITNNNSFINIKKSICQTDNNTNKIINNKLSFITNCNIKVSKDYMNNNINKSIFKNTINSEYLKKSFFLNDNSVNCNNSIKSSFINNTTTFVNSKLLSSDINLKNTCFKKAILNNVKSFNSNSNSPRLFKDLNNYYGKLINNNNNNNNNNKFLSKSFIVKYNNYDTNINSIVINKTMLSNQNYYTLSNRKKTNSIVLSLQALESKYNLYYFSNYNTLTKNEFLKKLNLNHIPSKEVEISDNNLKTYVFDSIKSDYISNSNSSKHSTLLEDKATTNKRSYKYIMYNFYDIKKYKKSKSITTTSIEELYNDINKMLELSFELFDSINTVEKSAKNNNKIKSCLPFIEVQYSGYINNNNNQKELTGKLYYSNGAKYTGSFKNNNFNGHGRVIFPDGTSYEGYFNEKGQMEGKGCFTDLKGNIFDGYWYQNKKHGYFQEKYFNDFYYYGNYTNNLKCGESEIVLHNKRIKGKFNNNLLGNLINNNNKKDYSNYIDCATSLFKKSILVDNKSQISNLNQNYVEIEYVNGNNYKGEIDLNLNPSNIGIIYYNSLNKTNNLIVYLDNQFYHKGYFSNGNKEGLGITVINNIEWRGYWHNNKQEGVFTRIKIKDNYKLENKNNNDFNTILTIESNFETINKPVILKDQSCISEVSNNDFNSYCSNTKSKIKCNEISKKLYVKNSEQFLNSSQCSSLTDVKNLKGKAMNLKLNKNNYYKLKINNCNEYSEYNKVDTIDSKYLDLNNENNDITNKKLISNDNLIDNLSDIKNKINKNIDTSIHNNKYNICSNSKNQCEESDDYICYTFKKGVIINRFNDLFKQKEIFIKTEDINKYIAKYFNIC